MTLDSLSRNFVPIFSFPSDIFKKMDENFRGISQLFSSITPEQLNLIIQALHQNELLISQFSTNEEKIRRISVEIIELLKTIPDSANNLDEVTRHLYRSERVREKAELGLDLLQENSNIIKQFEMIGLDELKDNAEDLNQFCSFINQINHIQENKKLQFQFLLEEEQTFSNQPVAFLPPPEDTFSVFFPDNITHFKEIEKGLILYKYLSADFHWLETKKLLAEIIQTLLVKNYFKPQKRNVKQVVQRKWIKEYFEYRYHVSCLDDQFKPSKVQCVSNSFPIDIL